jgi:hypothetical protein
MTAATKKLGCVQNNENQAVNLIDIMTFSTQLTHNPTKCHEKFYRGVSVVSDGNSGVQRVKLHSISEYKIAV